MTESTKPPTRQLNCWVEGFLEYTENLALPRIIRLWAGIAAFSGLLERRVWTTTGRGPVYLNLFVLIITPPGIGKSLLLNPVDRLWHKAGLFVAPDNTTKASFLDVLQASGRMVKMGNDMLQYHALQVVASEFGVFCPAHDLEYLSTLTRVYDCGDTYKDFKRSRKDNQIDIVNPHLNLIAGTQPDYLAQFLPDAAWGQGFMARVIMVYSDEVIKFDMWGEAKRNDKLRQALETDAKAVMELVGNVAWERDAQEQWTAWVDAGCPPVPEHLKLKHYAVRRPFYLLKLATISAVARGHTLVHKEDVTRAIEWLTEAEATMPEIFKAMKGNSDYGILQELQLYVTQLFVQNGGKPVHESRLVRFLSERTVAWNISKLLEAADRAQIIVKLANTETWKPGAGKLGPET